MQIIFRTICLSIGLFLGTLAGAETAQIHVQGSGTISTEPDMATISLGVTTEARSATAAMAKNNDLAQKVYAALTDLGVAEKDIQTNSINLSPRYSRSNSSQVSKLTGFLAQNRLSIRVKDLDSLGSVLDHVITLGVTDIGSLQFGLQEPTRAKDEALALAVMDARRQAEAIAEAAGVSLGPVTSISHASANAPRPVAMEMAMARDAVPIARGEVGISANVSVTFAIAD